MGIVKTASVALVLIAAVACASEPAGKASDRKITLKQTFPTGKWAIERQMTMIMKARSDKDRREVVVTTNQTMFAGLEVPAGGKDGTRKATWTWLRVIEESKAERRSLKFDSAKADRTDPWMVAYLSILGEKAIVTIDQEGCIVKVEGLDKRLDKVAREFPRSKGAVEMVKRKLGDAAVKDILSAPRRLLPDKPVAGGDSWGRMMTSIGRIPGFAAVPGKYTCTLKKVPQASNNTQHLIEAVGWSFTDGISNAQGGTGKGMPTRSRETTRLYLDATTGMFIKQTTDTEVMCKAEVANTDSANMEVSATITMTAAPTSKFKTYPIPAKKKDF